MTYCTPPAFTRGLAETLRGKWEKWVTKRRGTESPGRRDFEPAKRPGRGEALPLRGGGVSGGWGL